MDESVEGTHDLLNAGFIIPPMNVEEIDIIRPQLLERIAYGNMERLVVVSKMQYLLFNVLISLLVIGRVL